MDIVEIALSEVGYINKRTNADLYSKTANASTQYNMYTKYGKWYGLNPAPWCGIFLAWCAHAAGMDWKGYAAAYVPDVTAIYKSKGKYHARGTYTPRRGDVIIFGDEEHVGMVQGCSGGYVSTIEGNAGGGRVVQNTYSLTSGYIMGYGQADINSQPIDIVIRQGTYKNGSTPEPVYARSSLELKVGELNRYEECTKIGTVGDVTIVLYKVDGDYDYKVGFVGYGGS